MAATTSLSLAKPTSDILHFFTETPITCRFAATKAWLSSATELRRDFLTQHSSIAVLTSSRKPRGTGQFHTATVACALASETTPSLKDLPVFPYIDSDGRIRPPVEPGTEATVFAVYDNNMKVQYIGFSKDARNSLRTLMGRRPELCHFYKLYNLPALDQKQLLAIRKQWISELGTTPRGNSDVTQKNMWEKPVDSGSVSERGKALAAASKAKMLLQTLMDKGLKEQMIYDPALLEQGKCDVLPDKDISVDGQTTAARGPAEEDTRRKQVVINAPTGVIVEYEIFYEGKYKTNGGWMYDIAVKKDNKETRHRVICGRFLP
ncbi:hypothetical protein O6H91_19G078700 [Diphasiastrum complanatum]|uniref:Uncharacterized protein n=1 Tax=Diphasiastrum complanatum TaxID=34168 RepID=A0ACC2AWW0_DIPCM|nr:hypothetical protein O6H91_19G078700 [Diphasiastrum complanatum]